jgi:ABC-type multidrug transport system permease subunit
MSRLRLLNILKKEWQVMFSEVNSVLLVTLLPLIIVGQGILYIWLAVEFAGTAMIDSSLIQSALGKLSEAIPSLGGITAEEQLQVLLLSQFNLFLLLIPIMIAINFATFSIVEEKQSHSLEALLATPVRTGELLLGKALSGALPAIVVTWLCAGIFLLVVIASGWGHLISMVLTPSWFITLFLLNPAVAILSFLLGVVGSSRAKDSKSAQNIVVVIVLPVLALIGIQITGLVWFTTGTSLILALVIGAIDVLMLRAAIRLFSRESIVVSWR